MASLEKACGTKCRSRRHIGELIVAVSKGNLKQIKFFLSKCHNVTTLSDCHGRTVLHIAASCGKWQVMDWLVSELGMELGAKDSESGWTALHRSLFYGQIVAARLLISHGASTLTRDKEGLTALDIIMKDRLPYVEYVGSGLQEAYTWGENSNLTLGHETQNRRKSPEILDAFRKRNISIKQVSMNKYHTMFLSSAGQVYSCGHGRGGRLGLANEHSVLEPTLIESFKSDVCTQVFAARDHSLFLMESGNLYSCGMNDYHQLGLFPVPSVCLYPKQVNGKQLKGKVINGVCAQRFHTVVYTEQAVFTFGLNAGQLGHMKVSGDMLISQPRQVSALSHAGVKVQLVTCSDGATVVYTSKGDVYVLHQYQCRKIVSKRLNLVQVAVTGGHLDHSTDQDRLSERGGDELVIALLNMAGMVFLWRSSDPSPKRCAWSSKRSIHVTQLALNLNGLAFITKDGDALTASLPKVKTKTRTDKVTSPKQDKVHFDNPWTVAELVSKDEMVDVSIEKLAGVHRATAIVCEKKGRNFAVLQCQPNACLTEIPQLRDSQMIGHFKTLVCEADCDDTIHDCVLQIDNIQIATHKYILAYKSEYFNKIFSSKSEEEILGENPVIDLNGNNLALFKQILTYLYTDNCDIITVGKTLDLEQFIEQGKTSDANCSESITFIEIEQSARPKSAYEVFAAQKKSKKRGKNKEEICDTKSGSNSRSPVQALQEMAKKFGVKSLVKRLDAVKCAQGQILRVKGGQVPRPTLRFDRNKLTHLYDVTLKCQDGLLLQAHRCILVAGLEYFRSMLASGWVETSATEPLMIPVQGDIMSVILDYLYTDGSLVIDSCVDAEFIMNVLVMADQLLMTRLREMCEVSITSHISLKNACELLELSAFYNAHQLKVTCQQFVCLNLAALLESHSLDVLSDHVIEDLTQYYKDLVPGMDRRIITTYSGFPTLDYLELLEMCDNSVSTKQRKDSTSKDDSLVKKCKPKKKRNRSKSTGEDQASSEPDQRTSVSSDTDNRLSLCSDTEQALHDLSEESTPRDAPIEASRMATVQSETNARTPTIIVAPNCGSLAWGDQGSPTGPLSPGPVFQAASPIPPVGATVSDGDIGIACGNNDGLGLRHIMAQQASQSSASTVKTANTPKKKSISKLSQKERKRLAQETKQQKNEPSEQVATTGAGGVKPKAWTPPSHAWGGGRTQTSQMIKSFKDLVIEEEQHIQPAAVSPGSHKPVAVVTSPVYDGGAAGDTVVSFGLAARSKSHKPTDQNPKPEPTSPRDTAENPWQMPPTTPVKPTHKTVSFTDIIEDETKQNESLQKITNKPLNHIQIEEQAMQELLAHYTETETVPHVRISVERTSTAVAAPTWAAKQTHRQ